MNQYDKKLNELLEAYGVPTEFQDTGDKIHTILMDVFKKKCEGKRTALWGAGRKNEENSHAAVILKKYTTYIQTMCCIIDSLPGLWGDSFMGYPIISSADIKKEKIDVIIVSSKVQADSIKKDIIQLAPQCEIIDIYEELRNRRIMVYHKFYEESSIYTTLFSIRKEYEAEQNPVKKEHTLKMLIGAYLSIRDFEYAFQYIEEYIQQGYEKQQVICRLKIELETLLNEVKRKNQSRTEDIVVLFIDSLRAMDVFEKTEPGYQAKMLKKFLSKSCVFTNAKSTGVTTYESMISVICERLPYSQNVYKDNITFSFEDFPLLPLVKQMGYDIRFYISEGYTIIKECKEIQFKKQIYFSEKLWQAATDMADSSQKMFQFIYFPYEMHFPLVCGFHKQPPQISGFVDVGVKDTSGFAERQLEECKAYVDKQMDFYDSFFSDEILMTLFSDHSQVVFDKEEQKPYFMYYNNQDRCVNVSFFMKGFGLKQEWKEDLVSLYDFNSIMKGVIKNRKICVKRQDIVQYQYYKIHYKKLREIAKEKGLSDYIDGIRCFTSKDFLYVITATGIEEVYNLKNRKENIIGTKEGEAFAKKVKETYDLDFPAFFEEE